ncbi:organelle RRM domain-containing protein 6, chloroplastic-like [Lycium barbarum]|uniref:organelle RRM domain-containing protein 6, chloroplastic-like n=1 Tax=Lycium barbarum TaxID=112863 RepID=UPI00293E297E|nr:organelle RRM domain-containing protein 6, chloroplastic-like [Lycium barbarum]
MSLFCLPCNNSLISPSQSFTSSASGHASAFKPLFPSLPVVSLEKISNFKPSILIDLSQNKSHFPRCLGSSVEPHNHANSTTSIFLKGLAKSTSEGRLKVVFSQFGDVSRVKILTDKKSKQPLGFAYIWFPDNESAQSAVQEMNGKFLDGRFIQVQMAKPGSCKPNVKTAPYKF